MPDRTPEKDTAMREPRTPRTDGGAAAIVASLRRAILAGEYGYDDRLPPERQLATHYGASRGTVREALRKLQAMNLVTRRVGSGTFVRYSPEHSEQDDITEITSPLELIDVRFAVEPQLARLAVLHARERDVARLGEALQQLEASGHDPNAFSSADEQFHLCLADATRNRLLQWIYRRINEVRGHRQWHARKDKILTRERMAIYNAQHRRIYTAVRARDVEAAVASITEHLHQARRDLLGSSDA